MMLRLQDVSVALGGRRVLTNTNLVVEAGAMTAVMGPSGSGKSTLLTVLAGLLLPTTGERLLVRADLTFAWIFQNSPVLARRTARDNVALGPLSAGRSITEARNLADMAMTRLAVGQLADQVAYRLSGGEKQRLAVARCVATRVDVILADEPTASLDASNRRLVCDSLRAAASTGSAVIVATHDEAVAQSCDTRHELEPSA